MKLLLAVTACALTAGCGSMPRYQTRPVAIVANPSIPAEQAKAICLPRARAEAARAQAAAQAQVRADRDRVTGYRCTTDRYGNRSTTDCTPQTGGTGGFSEGLNQALAPRLAYDETGAAVFTSCIAEYGWATERVCVQNCK